MDKYEYKLRADEIKSLIQDKKYKDAVAIADTIDWKNVRNSVMLCTISDLYKVTKRYSDSREVLLLAYDRNPSSRMILYSLCELSIKLGDVINAIEFYKEFVQVAPHDTGKYILHYKLISAEGGSIEERIELLEELQKKECKEKWMFELANLYHLAGESEKCVEECNQIIIYFGEGKYVIKALELMSAHKELTPDQEFLYARLTNPVDTNIVVNTIDVSSYNPDDLQKELANNLKEILTDVPVSESEAPVESQQDIVYVSESEVYTYVAESEVESAPILESEVAKTQQEVPAEEVSFDTAMYKPVNVVEVEAEEATKIIDTKAVNKALSEAVAPVAEQIRIPVEEPKKESMHIVPPSEIEFKGQVIEPKKPTSSWDMHEIDFGNKNSEAIKYPNYDDMVSLEGDGQISIVLPEQERVDKQITGQISIDDILLEWERLKTESDKKWQEDVKQRVLSQTTDLFKNFEESSRNGLLEELEISVAGGEKVVLTADEQVALLTAENPEALNFSVDDVGSEVIIDGEEIIILEEDTVESESLSDEISTSEVAIQQIFESETSELYSEETSEEPVREEIIESTANSDEISEIRLEEDNISSSEIKEIVEEEQVEETTEETILEPKEEDPSPEELYFDRTPYINEKEEENYEVTDDTAVLPKLENLDYFMQYAAAIEEHDVAEKIIFGVAEKLALENSETEVVKEEKEEETVIEVPATEEQNEETITEEVKEESISDEVIENESEEGTLTVSENAAEPELVEETNKTDDSEEESLFAKFLDDDEQSEEGEVAKEDESEEKAESAEPEEEKTEESEEEIDSPLTEAQQIRFEDFIQNENADVQIAEALTKISMEASHGNVIIGSDDVDGAVELGKALITEIAEGGELTGKVAKIKASTLNAKDVKATLCALYDGAIIIQDVSDLKAESLTALEEVVNEPDKNILVVLTANQRLKHKFIMENKEIMKYFDVSLDTVSLDDRDLVNIGLKYANDQEYAIDELGLLALHRIIGERQTNSHAVTVSEVKEIVDEAIDHASKKNVGHFFDVLVGKRYDDNDMIVLREKDFE